MKKTTSVFTLFTFLAFTTMMLGETNGVGFDTKKIDELTGAKGVLNQEEGVFKVSFPRTDVKVTVDGWTMKPFMGLTSWAAFKASQKDQVIVMGDLVLFEDEVNPVMSAALDSGLAVTALHNHFFYDTPKVFFMHIGGEASLEKLAKAVRATQDKVKEIRSASAQPAKGFEGAPLPEESSIDGKSIEQILGTKGQANNGMFKAVIGRKAKMHGMDEVGKEMGVNTWAAFAGSNENSIVDGDFIVLESELQPVLKSLRAAGINIVAIHHHMTHEQPRFIFLHYWGKGAATQLAQGVRKALDQTQKSQQ
jgi:hypothetical protein